MTNETVLNTAASSERLLQLEVRARKLLAMIENRSCRIQDGVRQAAQLYFSEEASKDPSYQYPPIQTYRSDAEGVDLKVINRYASEWRRYIPQDAETRASLIHLISQNNIFHPDRFRRLQAALGFDDDQVQRAYEELYSAPFDTIFKESVDTIPTALAHPEDAKANAYNAVAEEWDLSDEETEWVFLRSGEVLYEIGDPGEDLFIVVSGRVFSATPANGADSVVTEHGRGEMIGDIEALTREERSSRVFAVRDSELIRLTRADLNRLAEKKPRVMNRMMQDLARRLKSKANPPKKEGNNLIAFAVAPAGRLKEGSEEETIEWMDDFSCRFAQALGSYGPTLLINSAALNEQLGAEWAQIPEDHPDSSWLAAYLSEQEAHYRYLVYVTDPGDTPWTRRSLRQADRILFAASAEADKGLGEVERIAAGINAYVEKDLVLIHPEGTSRPSGTRKWLDLRNIQSHYHAHEDCNEDLNRLARMLTGRGRGLVLSGGGARGYAHLGVLRALKQAGIEIDVVGGTSMGSIIGAVFAMDIDEMQLMSLVHKLSSPFKLFDLTLPLVSFFKSEKMSDALHQIFDDIQIEDLWRPYFCVSSSLTRANTIVHTRGSLWEAVRASSAIPGVFSPLLMNGELLVDGAVLNNFPVDVMRKLYENGPIFGVNVFPEVDLEREYSFGSSVSGWEVLLRKLNPFSNSASAPLIFENILRVIALNDVQLAKAKSHLCELYIAPPVGSFGILEFQSYEKIIEIGYRAGMEAIDRWIAPDADPNTPDSSTNGKYSDTQKAALPSAGNFTSQLSQSLEELDLLLDNFAVSQFDGVQEFAG